MSFPRYWLVRFLGDHCSPISDTTILSSMASSCNHIDHVRTQLPYALTVGAVATLLGTLPSAIGVPSWICFPVGIAALYGNCPVLGEISSRGSCLNKQSYSPTILPNHQAAKARLRRQDMSTSIVIVKLSLYTILMVMHKNILALLALSLLLLHHLQAQVPSFSVADTVSCEGETVFFTNDCPNLYGYGYNWDFGDGYQDTSHFGASHFYPQPGNYQASLDMTGDDYIYVLKSIKIHNMVGLGGMCLTGKWIPISKSRVATVPKATSPPTTARTLTCPRPSNFNQKLGNAMLQD